MRVAGAFLSGFGHAGFVGLALVGPPFLWAPPDRPVPSVAVTFLTAAEHAALGRPPAPPPPASFDTKGPCATQLARPLLRWKGDP